MKNKVLLISLLLPMVMMAGKTEFTHSAKLNPCTSESYYKIPLKPDLTSCLNSDYSDFRILNSQGKEVPYVLESEDRFVKSKVFKAYEIVTREHNRQKGYTRLVIKNNDSEEITNISLIIRNADVSKWLELNGSDDASTWFALKDRYYFRSFFNNNSTHEIRVLNFPKSNYRYFELLIYDHFDNPIDITDAGYYDYNSEVGKYFDVPQPEFSQTDTTKDNKTLVTINFDEPQYVDKLRINVSNSEFYHRNARLFVLKEVKRKKKVELRKEVLASFVLSSNSYNTLYFDRLKCTDLYLEIDNYNDQPLGISGIDAWQLKTTAVCKLVPGEQYSVFGGNPDLGKPVYDLAYFKDQIDKSVPIIEYAEVQTLSAATDTNPSSFSDHKMLMWGAIGLVLVIVVIVSLRIVREMKSKEQ